MEDGRDPLPQARADPARMAGVDRLPRAAPRWDVTPRPAAMHHRQHALQLLPQIAAGTSTTRRGWLNEQRDLRPGRLAEFSGAGHDADGDPMGIGPGVAGPGC